MSQRFASLDEVVRAAKEWDDAFLECRRYGHSWKALRSHYVRRWHYYADTAQCRSCGTLRHEELNENGIVLASWYSYAPGYLTEDGIGRIVGEAKGAVRLAHMMRNGMQKSTEEPHSSATKRAVKAVG